MTAEGIFPKINGDILYAGDLNSITNIEIVNGLKHMLGANNNNLINRYFNLTPGNNMIVNNYYENVNGSIFPFISGPNLFSTTPGLRLGSAGSIVGDATLTLDYGSDGTGSIICSTNDAEGSSGSIWFSGTGLNNMFNTCGGYIRVNFSNCSITSANGTIVVKFAGENIINKVNGWNTTYMNLDIFRTGGSFYYKLDSGASWGNWTGPVYANGSPYLFLFANCGGVGQATLKTNWIRAATAVNSQFVVSGDIPYLSSYITNGSLGPCITTIDGIGTDISKAAIELSLNKGVNYTIGSLDRWTNINNTGSVFCMKYTQSGNYAIGSNDGVIVTRWGGYFH